MSSTPRPGKPPAVQRSQPTYMEAYYLRCLQKWQVKMKRPPWIRELSAWLEKSPTAVYAALVALEAKGWVRRAGATMSKADRRFVVADQAAT